MEKIHNSIWPPLEACNIGIYFLCSSIKCSIISSVILLGTEILRQWLEKLIFNFLASMLGTFYI